MVFEWIAEWREKRRLRRDFAKSLSSGQRKPIDDPKAAPSVAEPSPRHFQYIIVNIDDSDPDRVPALIGSVVAALVAHDAGLQALSSTLIVGVLGLAFPRYDSAELRAKLVTALLVENGARVRIAHGECTGLVGNFGTEGRYSFGGIIPGQNAILRRLHELLFGAALEIRRIDSWPSKSTGDQQSGS